MTRANPHVPRPREGVLPNGDLAVVRDRQLGNEGVVVPLADRPLHELLLDVLKDSHVPDTMPARLAIACDNLVEVRDTVEDIDRGRSGIAGRSYGLSYLHAVRDAIDDHRDRDPLTLGAVGCSGSKHTDDELLPARARYKGSYWSGKRGYGETCTDEWRIISAEHAVLHPDTEIEYYERTPDDLEGIPVDSDRRLPNGADVTTLLDRWALDVHDQLAAWLDEVANGVDPRDVEVAVLLGRDYRDRLADRGVFDALRVAGELTISFPFQDEPGAQGGMIQQIGWMGDEVDAHTAVATDGGDRDV